MSTPRPVGRNLLINAGLRLPTSLIRGGGSLSTSGENGPHPVRRSQLWVSCSRRWLRRQAMFPAALECEADQSRHLRIDADLALDAELAQDAELATSVEHTEPQQGVVSAAGYCTCESLELPSLSHALNQPSLHRTVATHHPERHLQIELQLQCRLHTPWLRRHFLAWVFRQPFTSRFALRKANSPPGSVRSLALICQSFAAAPLPCSKQLFLRFVLSAPILVRGAN